MATSKNIIKLSDTKKKQRFCVSCGVKLQRPKLRYCSMDCKEKLMFALRWLTNLLYPMSTRYASFFFTDSGLMINLISVHYKQSLTFYSERAPGNTPASDLKTMILNLSRKWYNENERVNCRQLASISLLERAQKGIISRESIKPDMEKKVSNISKHLTCLSIPVDVLESENAHQKIKAAFRKNAMKHHPDHGGDDEIFKKIIEAYNEITHWIDHPTYKTRRGVRGMWSFDGDLQKWYPPL